jgi:hypothetical protein
MSTHVVAPPSSIEAPAGLLDDNELPVTEIPDVPHWSENYWYVGSDPDSGHSFFLHLGRSPHPELWREMMVLLLPSGDALVSKGFGRQATARGPAASTLSFQCEQPWQRWRLQFDGAAVPARTAALENTLVTDGPYLPVRFDLSVDGLCPAWVLGEEVMANQDWGDLHYEQICRLSGGLSYGDVEVAFDGTVLRDHTRGPRDLLLADRHALGACVFPSGRAFHFFEAVQDRGRMLAATVIENGRLFPAEVTHGALLQTRADAARSYELQLRWAGGSADIQAQIIRTIPMGFAGYSELTVGFDHAVTYCALYESQTRFTWDGEVADGWTERSVRTRTGR